MIPEKVSEELIPQMEEMKIATASQNQTKVPSNYRDKEM